FRKWLVNTEEGKENVLIAIPLYHVYGMVLGMNLAVLLGAGMILIPESRNLDNLLSQIELHHATIFPGVPNLYGAINRFPAVQEGQYDLSSIKACISGSATLPKQTKTEFERFTGGYLVEGYGLSEAPTATHCNPILGENRIGSIGLPLPDVDCRIVDIETGTHDVPQGGIGELIVYGPQVMQGYYNQPAETELVLRDGWLFTGDICRMDAEGYFYLIDRKKDVIKIGGFQVWPNEVEKVILENPKVQDTAVAGVFDHNKGELVKAWVVIRDGETVTGLEIISWCKQYLTRYKVPTMVEFVEVLPQSGIGKVLRRVLVKGYMQKQINNKKA
ncbi:MAG: AMP-binding protein, partial [Chloroflexota bacterium]